MATATPVVITGPQGVRLLGGKYPAGGAALSGSAGLGDVAASGGMSVSGPSVPGGTWQRLTVASHLRKVGLGAGSNTARPTFDPTYAQAADAISPTATTGIPWRSFCQPIVGEPGLVYFSGSLHGNYPGNEIDRINVRDLSSTVITTTLSHQPVVSPEGPGSGYGSGSGEYVYKQYGTALGDPSAANVPGEVPRGWAPYPHHHWTKSSWNPTWGFTMQVVGAKGDGTVQGANPLGAGTQYQQPTNIGSGAPLTALVSFDYADPKYRVRVNPTARVDGDPANAGAGGPGLAGASDWSQHRMSTLYLTTLGGLTYVREHINTASSVTAAGDWNFNNATLSATGQSWPVATSGNGVLLRHMEASKYLGLRADQAAGNATFDACHTLFLFNAEPGYFPLRTAPVKLTVPSTYLQPPAGGGAMALTGDGNLTFWVEKNSRRVFWLTYRGPAGAGQVLWFRVWVSPFDDLMNWTEITTTDGPVIVQGGTDGYEGSWLASVRQPMWFYNGHLFVIFPTRSGVGGFTDGSIDIWRVKVDGGETLTDNFITFNRYDYWAQNPATNGFRFSDTTVANLQMIGTKHVSWAYSPLTGKYHQHAGDFGMSTCQSMCTLQFTGAAPNGYVFTEVLDETTNAPVGKVRPSSPDDGYWFYVPADSAYVAGRGKFIWVRGGDGEPMFYNGALKNKYGSADTNGTIAQVTTALADRWNLASKLYLFDPTTATFDLLGATHSFDTSACTPPSAAGASFPVASYNGWTQDNGTNAMADVWTIASNASRNGAFDPTTGCLWRFYAGGRLARFDMSAKTVKVFNISLWVSDETGRRVFLDGSSPGTYPVIADGTKPNFYYQDTADIDSATGVGRYKTYGAFEWEHKATWIDPATGYLYVISPGTGYLWRFDTRGAHTDTGNGWMLPFKPIGKRIPFNGAYPALNSFTAWPPELWGGTGSPNNARVQMASLLIPYKGGLLFISALSHDSGVSGEPHYAFWRRLGYTGDWSVVTMPQEFAANTAAAQNPYSIDNTEVLAISQAFTDLVDRQFYRYFWKLT